MRKLAYLLAIGILGGLFFMTSCKTDEETPQDLKPTINFKGGANYISQDATLNTEQAFTIGITSSSNANSGSRLVKLEISRIYNNNTWFTWDTVIDVAFFNIDINMQAINVVGTERIAFKVTDAKGQFEEISLNITTEMAAGPINFYTQKVLGSYLNLTIGSSFASVDGTVYTLANAKLNADKIDWLYFYGATNQATLAAPDDAVAATVYNNATNGLQTWSVKNATRFRKVTNVIDWNAVTDDIIIIQETATGVTESKINMLQVGNILAFETVTGKKGLIKVDAITTGTDGTIEISVKVQQ